MIVDPINCLTYDIFAVSGLWPNNWAINVVFCQKILGGSSVGSYNINRKEKRCYLFRQGIEHRLKYTNIASSLQSVSKFALLLLRRNTKSRLACTLLEKIAYGIIPLLPLSIASAFLNNSKNVSFLRNVLSYISVWHTMLAI